VIGYLARRWAFRLSLLAAGAILAALGSDLRL
jgi:hypothetical protein